MDELYEVRWNGHVVGHYIIDDNDMWYYGGTFTAELSSIGMEFKDKLNSLSAGMMFNDFTKGIPVIMHPKNKPQNEWHVILLKFKDEKLHLRAITYLIKD